MKSRKRKTLEDFPKFVVESVRIGETSQDGFTRYMLDGKFDRFVEKFDKDWFYLIDDYRFDICATPGSPGDGSSQTFLICDEKTAPPVLGKTLFYLSPYWYPYNIWMVLDPNWIWNKTQFKGVDAIAQDYEAEDVSIVDGESVKIWTKLEAVDGVGGSSRHYPAENQKSPPDPTPRVIAGGWGHAHCTLCHEHIDADEFGYLDRSDHWMCARCYKKYVIPHDLAFVDEL